MVFDVAVLVQYLSRFVTLESGDLVSVAHRRAGMGRQPSEFLNDGYIVELGVEQWEAGGSG